MEKTILPDIIQKHLTRVDKVEAKNATIVSTGWRQKVENYE